MNHSEKFRKIYQNYLVRVKQAKAFLNRPLTLSEKIIYSHLVEDEFQTDYQRKSAYINLKPDRVAMQDATGQMAILQFMNSGKTQVSVPTTIHCDHLICAREGVETDLARALDDNREVYDFLKNASAKYGIGFWEPGAGIIHQIVLENYALPAGLMIGTDSHTPNAGGLGMLAIGVGGADAVDVMAGLPWELKMPGIIGVELTGKLNGWATAKDVILKLAGILTVKGGTNSIVEYFGPGVSELSCTGKATICNMGAEIGATSSIFSYDRKMADYLAITGREGIAGAAASIVVELSADPEVYQHPERYYDQVIRINLDTLEPYINGPFTPDLAVPISEFAEWIEKQDYPSKLDAGLIGSCTNSSYEDISRIVSIVRQAKQHNIQRKIPLIINPGSGWIEKRAEEAGFLEELRQFGARILANACGPCIGQWDRDDPNPGGYNSIINSFNRNFAKRNDGNPNTCAFVASPDIVMAMVLAGDLRFNPLKDSLLSKDGNEYLLNPPTGIELPEKRTELDTSRTVTKGDPNIHIDIDPNSNRLQLLEPFPKWNGKPYKDLTLLMKVKGKCTTDHISAAGKWLKYRGHLDRISDNLLLGAINAFIDKAGTTLNQLNGSYDNVASVARQYKSRQLQTVIIAYENYGEGSSREHAAMEPRYLGVIAIIAKSFARIHETNLKKQGVLALTFSNPEDYDKIMENDHFNIEGLEEFAPGKPLSLKIKHADSNSETLKVNHSYSHQQIEWFKAGGAMNYIRRKKEPRNG